MTTDFQQGRVVLGARLRELRTEAGLTVRDLAARCGWVPSKVSKLENGRQTATSADLDTWARGTGRPDAADELKGRLRGLESGSRSWRRQLAAGHRPVQENLTVEYERSTVLRAWEAAMVVGVLQTAEYARHIFSGYSELHRSVRDVDEAVRARMRRQDTLYERGRRYHVVMGEAALRTLVCPPEVLAAQLDRLSGIATGLDTLALGIVPFGARLKIPPANGFWIYDERLVIAEDWHAELWLDDAESIGLYLRVWETLNDSAVYGRQAERLITQARAALSRP
ncbi:helix-turn-helix domain-containing protein [Streptomyces sp. NPDC092296]|uniref:helix-turn-helix domain-containing protein n=1 Tax=Streptomyces sp. NPDC092296 TaxID=3366012 RepID=UPI0037F5EA06